MSRGCVSPVAEAAAKSCFCPSKMRAELAVERRFPSLTFLDRNEKLYCIGFFARYYTFVYMAAELTTPQQLVLDFIEERSANGESPPTYREICKRFGYKSPKAAADHVAALERKGLVTRKKGSARGLSLVRPPGGIPLLGHISAGLPRDGIAEEGRRIPFDPAAYGIKNRSLAFALNVRGDSMIGRHIFDGDIVILEHEASPQNGDIVAALIDNESTLKTFVREGSKAWLRAENPDYPNLVPASDLQIQGVARAVIRFLTRK